MVYAATYIQSVPCVSRDMAVLNFRYAHALNKRRERRRRRPSRFPEVSRFGAYRIHRNFSRENEIVSGYPEACPPIKIFCTLGRAARTTRLGRHAYFLRKKRILSMQELFGFAMDTAMYFKFQVEIQRTYTKSITIEMSTIDKIDCIRNSYTIRNTNISIVNFFFLNRKIHFTDCKTDTIIQDSRTL